MFFFFRQPNSWGSGQLHHRWYNSSLLLLLLKERGWPWKGRQLSLYSQNWTRRQWRCRTVARGIVDRLGRPLRNQQPRQQHMSAMSELLTWLFRWCNKNGLSFIANHIWPNKGGSLWEQQKHIPGPLEHPCQISLSFCKTQRHYHFLGQLFFFLTQTEQLNHFYRLFFNKNPAHGRSQAWNTSVQMVIVLQRQKQLKTRSYKSQATVTRDDFTGFTYCNAYSYCEL